jgi:ketosteroid isomerase-like protein
MQAGCQSVNVMKRSVSLIILLLLSCMQGYSQKPEAEIRKIMDDQAAAWNRADIEGFMAIGYWRSEKLKFVSGDKVTLGWQQTLDNYKKTYGTGALMGKLTFSDLDITILSKDAAYVVGGWSLAREKDNPKGKFTLLWRKFKEGWRIVSDHSS